MVVGRGKRRRETGKTREGAGRKARSRRPGRRRSGGPRLWLALAVVGVLALVAAWWYRSGPAGDLPVEVYPSQGVTHVASLDSPHEPYNSEPPTSGPHVNQVARPGFHSTPVPPQILVHNLEHGNVVIYYRSDISEDVRSRLRAWGTRYQGPSRGVVVVPMERDGPHEVIFTAWTVLMRLERYDHAKAAAFIRRYLNKGPERLETP